MRFNSEYRYTKPYGKPVHTWSVVTAKGGMHLTINDSGEDARPRYHGGVETHWRQPPPYMEDAPPSHTNCWLIGGPCWHDGSSLWAKEHWIPIWHLDENDREGMLRRLEVAAEEMFTKETEDAI